MSAVRLRTHQVLEEEVVIKCFAGVVKRQCVFRIRRSCKHNLRDAPIGEFGTYQGVPLEHGDMGGSLHEDDDAPLHW